MDTLSAAEARRIVLAAQGFGGPRPASVRPRQIRAVLDRVGVLQLDSVNVLCRSHYLPLFSRLGPYARRSLDRMAWGRPRELFEYWGHQASLMPLSLYPLLRWRMNAARSWCWPKWSPSGAIPPDWSKTFDRRIPAPWAVIAGMTRLAVERPGLVEEVLALVTDKGPIAADDATPAQLRRRRGAADPDPSTGRMWNWQDAKIGLEWLFSQGRVTTAARHNFTRLYDLSRRVIPAEFLDQPAPNETDACRELIRRAARALGVATAKELRNYFQLPSDLAAPAITELVDSGELINTRIDGIPGVRYRWHRPADLSDQPRAVLSPFDSLIWDRDRIEKLFGFRYRISIYTKATDRRDGYYVLPFLLGDAFVARVDLKADRERSTLLVPTVNAEPGTDTKIVAAELKAELRQLAGWLGLERIVVGRAGNLAAALRAER
ncbi:winged helix-turn-helix domain-containing protein [Microlunatus sp. Gsoil 973]|uniref:winged helix-turn-helix domain-containing protein n=1 Tax=Microlunatus sp. Gsoil 973 TaxID=2672569 RepID=UPI0012B4DDC6|nr:crosslink repair DNA glycosylase YcaQ family protein [Microlunatus sp. Gsoil 973]QGN31684.1 winged helix-turn-helix domain-containing protein [Microlunatus sp. Gsoil 973]